MAKTRKRKGSRLKKTKAYRSALSSCTYEGGSHNICHKRAMSAARSAAAKRRKGAKGSRKRKGGKRCGCPKGTRSLTLKGGRKVCANTRPRKKCKR